MLNDVFSSAMQRESIKDSDPFDWEKEAGEEESNAAAQTLKTTLQLAGITGLTTRADLLNQSQKNGLGATLGNPSLMTPYGDHQNHMQISINNNKNNDNSNENKNNKSAGGNIYSKQFIHNTNIPKVSNQ